MIAVSLIFAITLVHFSSGFYGTDGLVDALFGFKKICFCRCGIAKKNFFESLRSGRLLGGESASPHQFPWLAILNIGERTIIGSLISDQHVLTSASPLYGVSNSAVRVTLGAHDRCTNSSDAALTVSIASVKLHPAYSPTNMDNDIALLRLRHVVPFSKFIAPVCMPFYGSEEITRVGWTVSWSGDASTTCTPRFVSLPLVAPGTCGKVTKDSDAITHDKGCFGPVGAKSVVCEMDRGAPVMMRWSSAGRFRLVGVTSPTASCDENNPALYTRVIDHLPWIYQNIASDCQCF